jgi:hypothetical protein
MNFPFKKHVRFSFPTFSFFIFLVLQNILVKANLFSQTDVSKTILQKDLPPTTAGLVPSGPRKERGHIFTNSDSDQSRYRLYISGCVPS